MFGNPSGADRAYVDAASHRDVTHCAPHEERAGGGQRDDNEHLCHGFFRRIRGRSARSMKTREVDFKLSVT